MASLPSLTSPLSSTPIRGSTSPAVRRAKTLPMTAGTGTGWPRFRDVLAEYFKNSDSVNFQGAFAYLDWSYVVSETYAALMHADHVGFGNSIAYLHWDFEIPTWNFELSVDVTDELAKYCVIYSSPATLSRSLRKPLREIAFSLTLPFIET